MDARTYFKTIYAHSHGDPLFPTLLAEAEVANVRGRVGGGAGGRQHGQPLVALPALRARPALGVWRG